MFCIKLDDLHSRTVDMVNDLYISTVTYNTDRYIILTMIVEPVSYFI